MSRLERSLNIRAAAIDGRLLILTVLASILGAYDFQLAPLLPILLPYLHMSHTAYGAFITFTVLISGISAFFGGPLADRYGRVLIIDVCLGFVTVLLFLNVLITNIVTFVILRLLMGIVAGPDCRRRRRVDSRHVAAPQPRARIRTADDRPGRRELPLQLRRRRDAADLSHLAIANLDHGIHRRRDVHPDRDCGSAI